MVTEKKKKRISLPNTHPRSGASKNWKNEPHHLSLLPPLNPDSIPAVIFCITVIASPHPATLCIRACHGPLPILAPPSQTDNHKHWVHKIPSSHMYHPFSRQLPLQTFYISSPAAPLPSSISNLDSSLICLLSSLFFLFSLLISRLRFLSVLSMSRSASLRT